MTAELQEALNRIEALLIEIRNNTRPKVKKERIQLVADGLPDIARLWNEWASNHFPKVQAMDSVSSRYKSCIARWKENPRPEFWIRVINKINKSDFCMGKNDRKWVADIEFLCRPDICHKILEGKYDNKETDAKTERKIIGYTTGPEEEQVPVYGK